SEDMRREYLTKKACAAYCTIACVHQVATFDFWRDPQSFGAGGSNRRRPVQIRQISQPLQPSRADEE
ncbi:MAG TPA: hypothetical protein VFQ92_19110, partial [Blastocatellia bacterium]|nr:hypothetical protein [Blastocatellia bacterium]